MKKRLDSIIIHNKQDNKNEMIESVAQATITLDLNYSRKNKDPDYQRIYIKTNCRYTISNAPGSFLDHTENKLFEEITKMLQCLGFTKKQVDKVNIGYGMI